MKKIYQKKNTLYIFIDESGNFDFSPKGTKYFVLTAFVTKKPARKRAELHKLRYNLLSEGIDQEYFHASEDTQVVRDGVYDFFPKIRNTYEIHSVFVQKNKTSPKLYTEERTKNTGSELYTLLCERLLQHIFREKKKDKKIGKIVVVLDSLYTKEKRKKILGTLKKSLHTQQVPFQIYMHKSSADINSQLADYCCWAIAVKLEREERRPYKKIRRQVKSKFDIFQSETTEYYKHKG